MIQSPLVSPGNEYGQCEFRQSIHARHEFFDEACGYLKKISFIAAMFPRLFEFGFRSSFGPTNYSHTSHLSTDFVKKLKFFKMST